MASKKHGNTVLLEMIPATSAKGLAVHIIQVVVNIHETFFVSSHESATQVDGIHSLVVFVFMAREHCLAQLFLEFLDQSARFLSTRQLEVIHEWEVEVEWIENLRLDLELHFRQRRVHIVQGLNASVYS
jgi:hypothetical protein